MNAESEEMFRDFAQARIGPLRALAYVTCGDWQTAEDAVSGALARLYLRWDKVSSPDAYARKAVVRAAIGEKRRPWHRERAVDAAFLDTPIPDRSGDIDERLRMRAALQHVPPRQRAALVLRFLEGLSVDETAEILGCSPGTVKSQTSRGLDTLRAVLAAEITERGQDRVVSHRGRA
ncbi:putative RNA polymerase ECF-subfamily sigma factor [Actinoplanes missouriensis 431]|uniref:Putative RNA polymerase ECF-subfamily sigma factor n=1 Tax=Actinoplanes missouriensis (strain ATCC 14538 / DSM 43046 / CBS 188.64 / JCM 3121 / NBRC 102363 / NCIMB 12654 / NRRL B-3342 / UNCC 431) TaxID=512565 RepID=I0H489_ACTM4|nr:SigE family RNA polymerase sigma factor [Actinoplanes missouriensis]BAL87826.1 putative RNA polymerase ECF-subfamily sigma factor [Actinoplanes missouriensis 431]